MTEQSRANPPSDTTNPSARTPGSMSSVPISNLSDKVMLALALLGEMTVADPAVIEELVGRGLAEAAGKRLVITEGGRSYMSRRTPRTADDESDPED